ncbi:MAG: lysophospholipid acyltransferase family protein [Gemmatimonadota bacterium]|nr:lysophospholipid acyltransferase family protein [Gemmatimonadota bacterium]
MTSAPVRSELSRKDRLGLAVGGGVLRSIAQTWRFDVRNGAAIESLRDQRRPFIFSLWHGQLLPLLWHHRNERIAVLISEHRDGELVARLAQSLGYRLIRGSSTRGGERALLGLVRDLRDGGEVAITPDGPRGPAFKYAPGALIAAQRSGAAILPIAAHATRAWRLRSWDRFLIPKPFARVTVAYGNPADVVAPDARAAAEQAEKFEALMMETTKAAGG